MCPAVHTTDVPLPCITRMLAFFERNIFYILQKDDGTWESGTIISDSSVAVYSFSEDMDVSEEGLSGSRVTLRRAFLGARTRSHVCGGSQ